MCVWRQNVNRDSIFCSVSDPFCCESKITINNATMNIGVHVSFGIRNLSRYMPRSGIAGSF